MGGEWVGILALAVGFVIWLISNLARGNEPPRRPGAPPAAGEPTRQRPSTTEIDRFLEEINRRRQQQQQRKPAQVEYTEPAPRPRVEERPVPVPRPRPAPAPKPQRPTRTTYQPPVQAIPTVLPVVTAVEPLTPPKPVRVIPPAPVSPQLKLARDLIASGQGLRTAIILNEVFGPPKSKRPR